MKPILAAIVIASSLCSCATNGDPSEGGLINFSSRKSRERIEKKQTDLEKSRGQLEANQQEIATLKKQL